MRVLSIDLETFSDVDIKLGVYRYVDTPNFDILLCGFAFDDEEVTVVDMASGEALPREFIEALYDPNVEKHAFNATFERVCLSKYLNKEFGKFLSPEGWWCTQKHSAMFGLPASLKDVAKVLELDEQKDTAGKMLINYFSKPCKKARSLFSEASNRHYPDDDPEKWKLFKSYNAQDVRTERGISHYLDAHYPPVPLEEKKNYWINEKVNDRGVLIDKDLCTSILDYNEIFTQRQIKRYQELTGLENPKSLVSLKNWLIKCGMEVDSITKDTLPVLIENAPNEAIKEALRVRQNLSKTSITKYATMLNAMCSDGRVHGVMNYYGANRTGRFAGRLIQTQNLPRNSMKELDEVRTLVKKHDWDYLEMMYDDIQDVFKQLIRTAIIAPEGYTLSVADYSAIEARVIAWLAGETETQKIFAPDGSQKIYESTAARMFHVPIETIAKGKENYPLRQRGKVATLALGYGGGVGAMRRMDVTHMMDNETDDEVQGLVTKWRQSNPHIVKFWRDVEDSAKNCIVTGEDVHLRQFTFRYDGHNMLVQLPSGRWLTYYNARIDRKTRQILYAGTETNKWSNNLKTYGGKLVENLVQATARDCLCGSITALDEAGFRIIFHVHDEIICEVPDIDDPDGKNRYLKTQEQLMTQNIGTWDKGIYHPAPGYSSHYYLKD